MEEKKEPKKKIFKIIKIITYVLIVVMGILLIVGSCKKTKALSTYDNYNYNYIVYIDRVRDYDQNYSQTSYLMLQRYNNGEWEQYNDLLLEDYLLIQNVLDVSDGLGISLANVNQDSVYLIATTDRIHVYKMTTINIYINKLTDDIYNDAYSIGLNATTQEARQQGVEEGKQAQKQQDDQTLATITQNYENAIKTLNDEIDRLEEVINSQAPNWGSFKALLGTIFTYPIQFFKEGFDVELFGVNVGGLILGIGMLLIMITILGFILKGKFGGKD